MSAQALPVLFSFRRCPYAMRARLALASARQTCELREVMLRAKPQALLDASPKATVPVLVTSNGQVIDESLDIMLWALEHHDPEGWLAPPSGDVRAMRELIARNDGGFKQHLDRYKYPQRYGLASGTPDRDAAIPWLVELDCRLRQSTFLFGEAVSLADMAIAPFLRQYAHTDREWFWSQDWPGLCRWLDCFLASSRFQAVMHKYAAWAPGQAPVFFPPAFV